MNEFFFEEIENFLLNLSQLDKENSLHKDFIFLCESMFTMKDLNELRDSFNSYKDKSNPLRTVFENRIKLLINDKYNWISMFNQKFKNTFPVSSNPMSALGGEVDVTF